MNTRARLARYAVWQALDFVVERAAAIVLILGLFLYLGSIAISHSGRSGQPPSLGMLHALGPMLMKNMLEPTWIMLGLLAANGISANDRTTGRFRFFFAKPVRVDAFYAQAFAINTALTIACLLGAVLLLGAWTSSPATLTRGALLIAACGVAGVSGLCFLFSAIWRFDWLATFGLWAAVAILYVKFPDARWLKFLPPMNVVGDQIDNLGAQLPVESGPLLGFVVFGLLCFTAGLVILRRRPLST